MKKEVNRLPTTQQALRCFQLCQNLTNLYLSVDLVRLDQRTGNVIILSWGRNFDRNLPKWELEVCQ